MSDRDGFALNHGDASVAEILASIDSQPASDPDVAPDTRSMIRKRPWFVYILGFVLGVVLFLAIVLPWLFSKVLTDSEPTIDSTVIVNSFDDVAELTTEEYNFTGVGKFTDDGKKFLGLGVPFTGKSFLLTYSGQITAGVKDIDSTRVTINDGAEQVLVTVPAPEVLSAAIDPDSIEVYDQSFNPLNQFSIDDVTGFLGTETDRNRNDAIEAGLLVKAEEHAERLIESQVDAILTGTDKEDYTIIVRFDTRGR